MTTAAQQPLFVERSDEMWEFRGETFEQHLESWQIVDEQVQKDKWKLGAVAASLKTRYNGKVIDRFAHDTRRSPRTIRDYAQTYRAFENGGRLPILSFSHHTVASRADDPIDAITRAHDKEWSVNGLEYWIKTGLDPDDRKNKNAFVPSAEMQKLHDDAVRAELDGRIAVVREWKEPVDPILSEVYHRMIEMLEWQRDRTLDRDCAVIVEMLAGNEGDEDGVGYASVGDIQVWLRSRCFFMSEHDLKARIRLMKEIGMLQDLDRSKSKGVKQRGTVTDVYEVHPAYLDLMADADESHEPKPTASALLERLAETAAA